MPTTERKWANFKITQITETTGSLAPPIMRKIEAQKASTSLNLTISIDFPMVVGSSITGERRLRLSSVYCYCYTCFIELLGILKINKSIIEQHTNTSFSLVLSSEASVALHYPVVPVRSPLGEKYNIPAI